MTLLSHDTVTSDREAPMNPTFGPRACPGCAATVQQCMFITADTYDHLRFETVTVDPDEVGKDTATVVRITVRPDRVWVVTPVDRLALLPPALASLTRAFFRVHICPTPPASLADVGSYADQTAAPLASAMAS
jgi:hypothetical protein